MLETCSNAARFRSSRASRAPRESGTPTTLGRGGTDLSAIAIGQALDSAARRHLHRRQRRDDRRPAAHSERADDRARVARRNVGARAARRQGDALQSGGVRAPHRHALRDQRACDSDRGTIVDESVDPPSARDRRHDVRAADLGSDHSRRHRIAGAPHGDRTGDVPARRRGRDLDRPSDDQPGGRGVRRRRRPRQRDSPSARRPEHSGSRSGGLLEALGRGHGACAMRPGVVHQVVDALSRVNVEIIHCTDSNVTISILVPAGDAARAELAVHEQFRLDAGDPAMNANSAPILTAMITPFDERGDLDDRRSAADRTLAGRSRQRRARRRRLDGRRANAGSRRAQRALPGGERCRRRRRRRHRECGHDATRESVARDARRRGGRRRRDPRGRSAITSSRRRAACGAISARSPKRRTLPVIIYNIPGRTGANMLPETLLQLAATHANDRRRQRVERRSQADRHDPARARRGFHRLGGRRPSLPAVFGARRRRRRRRRVASAARPSFAACSTRIASGRVAEAAAIHASLLPLIDALFATTSPIPVKWAMSQLGFRVGACRLPLDDMPARARRALAPDPRALRGGPSNSREAAGDSRLPARS